ncbi:Uncharacterised protein [Pandoraea pnomenusa]|uniref:Uncharacterized protein n=1 Tax=Pandoraea pnomenusa TaxID=93220 RepID=A0A378YKJ1_9BURK|nr:Uncharacterised protein [Pandoraea pnomenusa]
MTKTTPKGPTPSLIGGANGRPKRILVKRLSECYRCHDDLVAGTTCIEIPKLGQAYSTDRRVCDACFKLILRKTDDDLAEIRNL